VNCLKEELIDCLLLNKGVIRYLLLDFHEEILEVHFLHERMFSMPPEDPRLFLHLVKKERHILFLYLLFDKLVQDLDA
jgi:hypothetical protein